MQTPDNEPGHVRMDLSTLGQRGRRAAGNEARTVQVDTAVRQATGRLVVELPASIKAATDERQATTRADIGTILD